MGIYEVVLPFLLCFTIVFAFLEKTHVLGDSGQVKKFNIVIAVVMGLLLVQVQPLVLMINSALPKVSVAIVAIVMFFIIVAMFNGTDGINNVFQGTMLKVIAVVAAIFVAWVFWSSYTGGILPSWLWWVEDNLATIIVLGVFAAILGFITTEKGEEEIGNSPGGAAAAGAATGAAAGAQAGANAAASQQHQQAGGN